MGNAGGSDDQRLEFQQRLKRVSAETDEQDFLDRSAVVDTDELLLQPRRPNPNVKLYDWRENIWYPLSFVWVFLGGLVAAWASRYVIYHLFWHEQVVEAFRSGVFLNTVVSPYIFSKEIALAFGMSYMVKSMLDVEGRPYLVAQAAGIWVGAGTMHNLVHLYPDLFAMIYSREWIMMVLFGTEPNSVALLYRDVFFQF
ncbi:MAG: hypothetical protein HUJ27_13180 [Rhodobacteraceae bacterium]|nr:hypothetical protein [Paracoccaceae bacterium]